MKHDPTVEARKVLDSLWREIPLRGRPWGLKKSGTNCYGGTNILLATDKELVSISMNSKGNLRIHEFKRSKNTSLGRQIKKRLRQNNLPLEK